MKKVEKLWADLSAKQVALSEEQQVELASISELNQLQGRMNKMNASTNARFGKAQKNIQAIANAKENVRDSIRDMDDNIVSAQEIIKQGRAALSSFNKMAKELGLDATSSKEYKELEITVTNDMVDIVNDSKETLKELKSYAK